jgi:DNA replication and repair protein RecF
VFHPGPQLVHGPNAAGKTSLLEAIVLLAWGRSHRTGAEGELVRWGQELARIEARVGRPDATPEQCDTIEVALTRTSAGGARKRIRVNGVARRAAGLAGTLRTVMFAPEDMLLISGSPSLRREAVDTLASQRSPAYARDLGTYGRALQQRNGLLRLIREDQATRAELKFWDAQLLEAGTAVREERHRLLAALAEPLSAAHAEIAPDEAAGGRLVVVYATNAPQQGGESVREALGRRLTETADKEVWNGTTLIGPHRDDPTFEMGGRPLASFASRGQQRTAILAFKLAEVDLLTALDGRPPLLLLDDVFSELDPERRAHLVRRISALPQAFVTTTTLDDIDPALRSIGTAWAVATASDGTAALVPGP